MQKCSCCLLKALLSSLKGVSHLGASNGLIISLPSPGTEEIEEFRMILSTQRVARPWHKMPRESVALPPLEVFKSMLDEALSNVG